MGKQLSKAEILSKVGFDKEHENFLLMPNNIFGLLSQDEEIMKAKAPHVAFAYTYIYYITWLYRYAKYGDMDMEDTDVKGIKRMLTVSPTNKQLDYIIKKNGVLDRLGITKTVSFLEAPVIVYLDDYWNDPEFITYKEYFEELKEYGIDTNVKRKQVKIPLFALETRVVNDVEYNGTFYDKEHTHNVPFEVFVECMSNPELGYTAFYLYGYLASRCGLNGGSSVSVSLNKITEATGIRPTTRDKALDALKKFGLIVCFAQDYVLERGQISTDANVYFVRKDSSKFTSEPMEYRKRRVIHVSQYLNENHPKNNLLKLLGGKQNDIKRRIEKIKLEA